MDVKFYDKSQSFLAPRKINHSPTKHHTYNNFSDKVQLVSVKLQITLEKIIIVTI